jgi:catechol 2,3-dioxygenase-like lactoylglutathione lyase family enzyme
MTGKIEFWHDHLGVSVPDLEAAVTWYRDVLGFEIERRFTIDTIPAKVAMMINGNLRVEIFQAENGKPASEVRSIPDEDIRTHGTKHIAFAVEDVHGLSEELKKRGADIVWVKKLTFGNNMFLRDVAGNLIEFIERPKPPARQATA